MSLNLSLITSFVFIILFVVVLVLYNRTKREKEQFRIDLSRLQRKLDERIYDEDQVSQRLAAVGLAIGDAVLICKADRTVIYMNPNARTLFPNVPADNQSLIAIARHYEVDQILGNVLEGKSESERQLFINGRIFKVRLVAFEGGAVIALTDLTELQRLGRARRDFIANISHELRTPLTGIRLILDTIKTPLGRNPDLLPTFIDKIIVETESLSQLAQELLDLSSIESGQTVMKMSPGYVRPIAQGVASRLTEMAARKSQTITVEIADDLIALMDSMQVERVLLNIVHNGLKFTPEKGAIVIRAAPQANGDVKVEVADNGGGISREDLPRIFERFYRGDRARTTQGTGLGLAVAKHIIEAHGEKIWAESDSVPGHGSTFCFTLPRTQ